MCQWFLDTAGYKRKISVRTISTSPLIKCTSPLYYCKIKGSYGLSFINEIRNIKEIGDLLFTRKWFNF